MLYINIVLAAIIVAMIVVRFSKKENKHTGSTSKYNFPNCEIFVAYDGNLDPADLMVAKYDAILADIDKLWREYPDLGEDYLQYYQQEYIQLFKDFLDRLAKKDMILFYEVNDI